ncbi:MAG TPA: CHAT domain-containing protein [Albitalea sp.]
MDIRTVTVELLRAGPRHNQLISPLTQYLGICGNAPAGRVTLPYEHGDLEQRLQELRYGVTSDADPSRPSKMLDRTGLEIADILSAIPGVSGLLNPENERPRTLTHLRIVLSASELAMLPFETSKVPTGGGSGPVWLALQSRAPVCITRQIRSVSAEGIRWPRDPRVLFVAGPDTPVEEHEQALLRAMAPWRDRDGSLRSRLLTLDEAKLADISREMAAAAAKGTPFTHVHVLAHGAPTDETDRYSPVGLVLHDEDVVSGRRLATTLTSLGERGVSRPVVVTLASCDSGQVSNVRTTDASVAHDLHDQGIPLVVASQFPLSVEGSVPFVERFYRGQFWGEHPLVSMYEVRLLLHSGMGPDTHDWASLVVYEAFPSDLGAQLEELCYWQARRAHDRVLVALEEVTKQAAATTPPPNDTSLRELFEERRREVEAMSARLPTEGSYALECAGLRAGGHKRVAQAAFTLATGAGRSSEWREALLAGSRNDLEAARTEYWRAAKCFLGSWAEPGRKKANLHWLLGQVLSLDTVLGRRLNLALLTAARVAAEVDLESPDEGDRAWAHVSLAEFSLLHLAEPAMPAHERKTHARECTEHATRFLELMGRGSEHAFTTSRQFERYTQWWGSEDFRRALAETDAIERAHWNEEDGVLPTANQVVKLLRGSTYHVPMADAPRKPA